MLTGAFTVSKSCILCNVYIDGTSFNRHRWQIQCHKISWKDGTAEDVPPSSPLRTSGKSDRESPKKKHQQQKQQQRKPKEPKLYFLTKASTTAANAFKPVKNWRLEMAQAKSFEKYPLKNHHRFKNGRTGGGKICIWITWRAPLQIYILLLFGE